MLRLCHLGLHGIIFLAELSNLSVAADDISATYKNSTIILLLKIRKPKDKGLYYTTTFHCFAQRRRFWRFSSSLQSRRHYLQSRLSQYGFKPRSSITSILLPSFLISCPAVTNETHQFSYPTYLTDLKPRDMLAALLQVADMPPQQVCFHFHPL